MKGQAMSLPLAFAAAFLLLVTPAVRFRRPRRA